MLGFSSIKAGSSIFIVACRIFSCSMWDLVPWPGIELGTPAFGAWSLSHWATREGRGSFNVDGQERFLWEVACGRDLEGRLGLWLAGRHLWKSGSGTAELRSGLAGPVLRTPCRATRLLLWPAWRLGRGVGEGLWRHIGVTLLRDATNECFPRYSSGSNGESTSHIHFHPPSASQSCPTLCDPMDSRLPGSSVHGILQATILEWVAVSFSRRSSWPGIKPGYLVSPTLAGGFFTTEPPHSTYTLDVT